MNINLLRFLLAVVLWILAYNLSAETCEYSQQYSSTQGNNGWYYCYRDSGSGTCALMTWETDHWQGRNPSCTIKGKGLSPGDDDALLKWVAPRAGDVTVAGQVWCLNAASRGVRCAIKVNGNRIWPATGPENLSPDSWATHQIIAHVNAGDAVTFEVAQCIRNSVGPTSWEPTIVYDNPVSFTTGETVRVMNKTDCQKIGIDYFDMQVHLIPGAGRPPSILRWLHGCGKGDGKFSTQCFEGSMDHPSQNLVFSKPQAEYWSNPNKQDGNKWLMNIYRHSSGLLIGVTHVENCKSALTKGSSHFRLGISKSTDGGESWVYLGDVDNQNIGGGPFAIKDGFFHLYYVVYRDTGSAVARIGLKDLIDAAEKNQVPVFYKYHEGTWITPGMSGSASTCLNMPELGNHNDMALCSVDGKYYSVAHKPGRSINGGHLPEIHLYRSCDLLQWTDLGVISTPADPLGVPHTPSVFYERIVGVNGEANAVVGSSFYVYFTKVDFHGLDGGNNPYGRPEGNRVNLYRTEVNLNPQKVKRFP